MKKTLSMILAAAMMAMGFTAFAASAEEEPDLSIDSAQEYVDLVKAFNDGKYADKQKREFKVTADLDLSAFPAGDVVIKELPENQIIDFDGHTVSGIVREVSLSDHGNVGLLADNTGNYGEILNVKIKDCKLSVTIVADHYAMVGGVIGNADRGHVNSVEIENVTIELKGDGTGAVGMIYGEKKFNDYRDDNVSLVMKNVLIDAPNAPVGLFIGRQGDIDNDKIVVTKVDVSETTIHSSNGAKEDTYIGNGDDDHKAVSVAENAQLSVSFVDNAVGYKAPDTQKPDDNGNTQKPDDGTQKPDTQQPDDGKKPGDQENPPATGSASVVIAAVAVAALAGAVVAARKRDQD